MLSGWIPPQSVPHASELTAARTVENGDARPATKRRENTVEVDDRSGDVSGEPAPDLDSPSVKSQLVRSPRSTGLPAPESTERASALARGPPTSRT